MLLGSQDLLCQTGGASSGSYLLRKLTWLWAEPKAVPEPCYGRMRCCYCKQMLKLKLWVFAVHVKRVFPVQGTVYLLAAFIRGFAGVFLEVQGASWEPFLHAVAETTGIGLLLRMVFDQSRLGDEQLM